MPILMSLACLFMSHDYEYSNPVFGRPSQRRCKHCGWTEVNPGGYTEAPEKETE